MRVVFAFAAMGTLSDRYERAKRDRLRSSPRRHFKSGMEHHDRSKYISNVNPDKSSFMKYNNNERYPKFNNLEEVKDINRAYRSHLLTSETKRYPIVSENYGTKDFYIHNTYEPKPFGYEPNNNHSSAYRSENLNQNPYEYNNESFKPYLADSNYPALLFLNKAPERVQLHDAPKESRISRLRLFLSNLAFPLHAQNGHNKEVHETPSNSNFQPVRSTLTPKTVPGTFESPQRDGYYESKLRELRRLIGTERKASSSVKEDLTKKLAMFEEQHQARLEALNQEIGRLKATSVPASRILELEEKLEQEKDELLHERERHLVKEAEERSYIQELDRRFQEQTSDLQRRLVQLERLKLRRRARKRSFRPIVDVSTTKQLVAQRKKILESIERVRSELKKLTLQVKFDNLFTSTEAERMDEIATELNETQPERYVSMASKIAEYKKHFQDIYNEGSSGAQTYEKESVRWIHLLLLRLNSALAKSSTKKNTEIGSISNHANFLTLQKTISPNAENCRQLLQAYKRKVELLTEVKFLLTHRISLRQLLDQIEQSAPEVINTTTV